MTKPNFLIIGAGKAGTTSIFHLLTKHPDIFMCQTKEPHFFSMDSVYERGWEWYTSLFTGSENFLARGEASITYSVNHNFPKAPSRIKKHLPGVKLIYIVRHPLRRIESHWRHQRFYNKGVPRNFCKAIKKCPHLIDASLYWKQINLYRAHFPDDQILILFFEDFKNNPLSVLNQIFEFLSVKQMTSIEGLNRPRNVSKGKKNETIPLKLLKQICRNTPFLKNIGQVIPKTGVQTFENLLSKQIPPPPKWEKRTTEYTLNLLASDTKKLLEYMNYPLDYWKL